MKTLLLNRNESTVLVVLALFGLLVPNGAFLYFFFTRPDLTRAALANPVSQVLLFEAFFLMFLFAWLLKRTQVTRPSGFAFIVMSLVGSMIFSVPAALHLVFREKNPPKQ